MKNNDTTTYLKAGFLSAGRHLIAAVLPVVLGLAFSASSLAQTTEQLRTLFFDPVYIDDPEEILLSSSQRPGAPDASTSDTGLQPEPAARAPSEIIEDIRRYEESINQQIENSGIYNTELSQEYLSTGNLYEQLGDYENAVGAYDNAMHINRVNEGLYTLSQVDAVRALIDLNKRTRDFADVDRYQEYLYYLNSRSLEPDSDEFIGASMEWAEWNLEAFRRMAFMGEQDLYSSPGLASTGANLLQRGELVAIENDQFSEIRFIPRSMMLSSSPGLNLQSYTADQLVDPRLKQAEDLYEKLMGSNGNDPDLLKKKANLTWLYKKQLEQHLNFSNYGSTFKLDRNRLIRSLSPLRRGYADNREDMLSHAQVLEAESPLQAAELYVAIGDWDLTFSRQGRAYTMYDKARELLLAQDLAESQITDFISPEPALLIPEFVSHEYTREFQEIPESRDIPYIGFIDVNFEKRANGSLRRIDIVQVTENTSQQIRSRLLDMLGVAIMRPHYEAGETVEQSDIKVRYYYSY